MYLRTYTDIYKKIMYTPNLPINATPTCNSMIVWTYSICGQFQLSPYRLLRPIYVDGNNWLIVLGYCNE